MFLQSEGAVNHCFVSFVFLSPTHSYFAANSPTCCSYTHNKQLRGDLVFRIIKLKGINVQGGIMKSCVMNNKK